MDPFTEPLNNADREPVWFALSELYLDTDLSQEEIVQIVKVFLASPYTLEEIKEINKREVFPVLQSNLMSVAGAWAGFNREMLTEAIVERIEKFGNKPTIGNDIAWTMWKWMQSDYWEKIEIQYHKLE